MENVISFETKQPVGESSEPGEEKPDVKKMMLEAAGDIDFEDMVILGRERGSGMTHFYSIHGDFPVLLWLIEAAKMQLLSPQKPLRS